MGRVFMLNIDDPFAVRRCARSRRCAQRTRIIFVDFHAEATSEKIAMGWHLDGKVTAVVGTHTHVQTADERILPKGTAYLTDVGMTGPHDSIIGVEIEPALGRFLTALPARFETATGNPRLNAVDRRGRRADRPRHRHRAPELQRSTTSQQLADHADVRPVRSSVRGRADDAEAASASVAAPAAAAGARRRRPRERRSRRSRRRRAPRPAPSPS